MKLSNETVSYIGNLIDVCSILGIKGIKIDANYIRGVDPKNEVFIFHQLPEDFEISSIGLGRMEVLKPIFGMIKGNEQVIVDVIEDDDSIKALKFKTSELNIEYRCSHKTSIRAPSTINDKFRYTLIYNDIISILSKAIKLFGNGCKTSLKYDGVLKIIIETENGDRIEQEFDEKLYASVVQLSNFSYSYNSSMLLTILNNTISTSVELSERVGFIKTSIKGIDVYVIPKV